MSFFTKISTRRNFLILYSSIFLFFVVPYVIHLLKLGIVKTEITARENMDLNKLNQQVSISRAEFDRKYPNHKHLFDEVFTLSKATKYRDTIVTYFIYYNSLSIKSYDLSYTTCLFEQASSKASKLITEKKFEKEIQKLEKDHGSLVREWANKIGQEKFMIMDVGSPCTPYFKEAIKYVVNKKSFLDFDDFLKQYALQENNTKIDSELIKSLYQNELNRLKAKLSENEKRVLDEQLKNNSALKMGENRFSFSGNQLGSFDYTIPRWIIDEKTINDAMDIVYTEHYKNYSLDNGDMPYAYCYGSGNYGPSSLKVNAGNSDVLVMVKNSNDLVVRHFYVQANHQYSVRLNNGHYNVYFYYGKGWNPKKQMKEAICGPLIGGFIYYESLSKDPSRMSLHNQSMVYTLMNVTGGNLQTVPSNVNEAM